MGLFPGGGLERSTAVNSLHPLTIRNARRLIAERKQELAPLTVSDPAFRARATMVHWVEEVVTAFAADAGGDNDEEVEPVLLPGEEKTYSYWAPGLEVGKQHHFRVTVSIDTHRQDDQTLPLIVDKKFLVDAPQFSLPNGTVHSVYPPQGYHDESRILPHIVLTDPHLPWERQDRPKSETSNELARNRVPWLALFFFTQDELMLPPDDLNGTISIFGGTSPGFIKPTTQSSTFSLSMSIADLWATKNIVTPITADLGPESIKNSTGEFVFLKPDLFLSLFSNFNDNGVRQVPVALNTIPYGLLAHIRHVKGTDMALAGVEDTAVFSVVISNRAGPLDIATPTTVSVHLVSIEGVEI